MGGMPEADRWVVATLRLAAILTFVSVAVTTTASQQERPLQAGLFPQFPNAKLGARVNFENEIDTTYCYPLLVSGQVVAWLARAYLFNGTLLVQRCVEFDPSDEQTAGARHGGANEWWEEVRLSPDRDVLLTTRLTLPDWSSFSSPSFCSSSVAYWAFRGKELVPTVYDLRRRLAIAAQPLGAVTLETDNTGFLPTPTWDATCSEVSFDGAPIARPLLRLKPPSRR
jgi:hypothetical protein